MKLKIKYIFIFILLFIGFKNNVYAGTMSIWANASTVKVGQTVTISVKVSQLAGTFNITSSNQSILSGDKSNQWLEENTYTFDFKANAVGTATITATAMDVADSNENSFSGSKSVSINVISNNTGGNSSGGGNSSSGGSTAEKKEYSNDNTLSSLTVEGQKLTPEFSKDTTEYKLTVDESIEKIKVDAKATNNKATVNGTGEKNLSSGENTIEIKVIAENGNEKIYKIIVTVEDQHPINASVDNQKYTVVKKNNNLIEPLDGYEEKTIKINNQDVVSYYNKKTKVTLVLLKDKNNKINYYVYDEKTKKYTKYRYITVSEITLQLLDNNKKLENFKQFNQKIQNENVDIFKTKKNNKVGLIYGTNIKTGNTGYYVYDQTEGTLSRYYNEEINIYQNKTEKLKKYMMIGIGSITGLIIIIIIISFIYGKKKKKHSKLERRK